MENKNVDWYPC